MRYLVLAFLLGLLAGCGGGSAGGSAAGGGENPPQNASVAAGSAPVALDLGIQAASAQTVIYGVEVVLALPAGVTVAADPASGALAKEAFTVSDSGALSIGRYQVTAAGAASLTVNIADPAGFLPGELASVVCSDATGGAVSAAAFTVQSFSARDRDGVAIPEVTARLSVRKL